MIADEGPRTARTDGFVASIVRDTPIPPLALLRQKFDGTALSGVSAVLREELRASGVLDRLRKGMRVAVSGGSRGIASYPEIMKTLIAELKRAGAVPFIFPAMGSHGGATSEGQAEVLATLGITEESMGCPVLSSMETLRIGTTPDGQGVYADKTAWEADGIVLVNRVKYHTGFVGRCESGLVKMSVIGLGKQKGAETCHTLGLERMAENIEAMARVTFASGKILFGVATVENAYDRVRALHVLPAGRIFDEEPKLLALAKAQMPTLPVPETDVLIVDEIGKNISGGGMDPHVVGRFVTSAMRGGIKSQRLVVLDITDESHGSGIGLGRADLTTRRVFEKFDFEQTYPNALTSNVLGPSCIPIVMANDRLAVAAALKTCTGVGPSGLRVVRIKNSLDIEYFYLTANLIDAALKSGRAEVLRPPEAPAFDGDGRIFPFS
jgi:hypothetical protein